MLIYYNLKSCSGSSVISPQSNVVWEKLISASMETCQTELQLNVSAFNDKHAYTQRAVAFHFALVFTATQI